MLMLDRCMVCAERTIGLEIFLDEAGGILGDMAQCNLILVYLETVLVSMQDRCMVCAKCTKGSKIVLDAPDGTPR
jgi:hypothetical protein